jgi:nucleoside 2-deoxyribosyltransferase
MDKRKIYIAAPLFSEGERAFNERIDAILRACGHETFLPQREGGCVADLPETIEGLPKRQYLFRLDCAHMDWCDTLLFVFDGRVPDEGACFELGYCFAKGKRCIGYKTDARSFIDGFDNVMLHGAPETVLHSEEELRAFFTVGEKDGRDD